MNNQILALLPIIFASVAGQEKAFVIANATKYLSLENARLGNPLTAQQVDDTVNGLATLLIAEEKGIVTKVTGTKL